MEDVITINVAIISWVIFWLTYWLVGGLLTLKTHVNGTRKALYFKEVVSVLLLNMLWSLVGVIMLCLIPLRAVTLLDSHIIIKLLLTYIITDTLFYHIHLMLHNPQLYSRIHKLHHRFTTDSYALVAMYCTPYEAVILNIFSVSLGPIILQIPPPYLYIWYVLVAVNTVVTHSGLTLAYILDGYHDLHHSLTTKNYGISMYFDWIYGTYSAGDGESKKNEEKVNLGNFPIEELKLE